MPDSTLSEAIKEAYASTPSVVIYHTLEIWHAAFSVPIRVVRDVKNLSATLESTAPRDASTEVTFIAYGFDVVPPEVISTGLPQITIEIDNISRDIVTAIEQATSSATPVTVIYRSYVASDLSEPANNPPLTLEVFQINVTKFRVKMIAGFNNLMNLRFPKMDYSAETFPGLIAQ